MLKIFLSCYICSYIKTNKNYLITKNISCAFYNKNMNNNSYDYNVHVNKTRNRNASNRQMLTNTVNGYETVTREWDDTELGHNYRADHRRFPGLPFICLSYNILAQTYLTYHQDLYSKINPNFLQWEYRLDKILKELIKIRPHLLCMQEVEQEHYNLIKTGLKRLDYRGVYYKRTGDKSDGCAIFINKHLFDIQDRRDLNLYCHQEPLLGRDNIAILLKLSLRSNPKKSFVVANTHLLYNPKRDDVRLAQLQRIFSTLKTFGQSKSGKQSPIIFMGDFNFSPSSILFEFVTKGEILWDGGLTNECQKELKAASKTVETSKPTDGAHQYHKTAPPDKSRVIQHSFKLESILSRDQLRDRATTYHRQWIPVDHIFYTIGTDSNLKLLSTCLPPEIKNCFPIPNAVIGSDHYFVAANFLLK